jgi:hypothetical protein
MKVAWFSRTCSHRPALSRNLQNPASCPPALFQHVLPPPPKGKPPPIGSVPSFTVVPLRCRRRFTTAQASDKPARPLAARRQLRSHVLPRAPHPSPVGRANSRAASLFCYSTRYIKSEAERQETAALPPVTRPEEAGKSRYPRDLT